MAATPVWKRYGDFSFRDSGPPAGCRDFDTLIMFHGLGFNSSIFDKLFPVTIKHQARLVTVNRIGYTGSAALSDVEISKLNAITDIANKYHEAKKLFDHIKDGTKRIYDFLVEFISKEAIQPNGTIILAGWSFGVVTITGLLVHGDALAKQSFNLRPYIKHVVFYDAPAILLGYQPPQGFANPFGDPMLTREERHKVFPMWVSGHYDHGQDFSALKCWYMEAQRHPLPTTLSMDLHEIQACIDVGPMLPRGCDERVLILGATLGVNNRLREAVLYPKSDDTWGDIEIKFIWCDKSAFEMPWGALCMQNEIHRANKSNNPIRKVDMVCIKGANHFYHWEKPDLAIKELLSGDMMPPDPRKYGFFSINDSGPPADYEGYMTLIVFHGLGFNSAVFDKLFPFAANAKIRLVTVNRRGYTGAEPLSNAELSQLRDISDIPDGHLAAAKLQDHIKESARATYDFLVQYLSAENIPQSGGIIVAGWSFGCLTILGLLAHASEFTAETQIASTRGVDLLSYIKHVVIYDIPAVLLGYAPPPNLSNPYTDPSVAPQNLAWAFPLWVSGHYAHGEDFDNPKCRYADALTLPPPTVKTMAPSELQRCLDPEPMIPGGCDERVLVLGATLGVFALLKDAVIFGAEADCTGIDKTDARQEESPRWQWRDVKVKHVWCDHAAWEMPWAAICLQRELNNNAKNAGDVGGRVSRYVEFVRIRGANHFYHWDEPELALQALMSTM